MKAFICDRCGKTITMAEYVLIRKEFPSTYHAIDFDLVDMCPSCCAEFEKWWRREDESTK